ncbi:MAG: HAD family hydrolase [Gammaproteobacteria bacterium]|jgi:phosphoglycolate phosphatase|nr:HAD family hydrolase [Gammaproteobacteria bacterium]NDA43250.1 HAD family hydrolase [Gammaproteobacteria bacterium]NDB16313.1 HAD family hydrolase [Gammaproteobacteria bacterium]NDE86951.1 HAD family hydrolase [Gammaproteobacteria bacterium]
MTPRAILFDLDGTLVDSARSILAGLGRALESEGVSPAVPLSPGLIGPPLPRTLATLAGSSEPVLIERLAAAFRLHYDTTGYRETEVYAGVGDMLSSLARKGLALFIVTNKRIKPTRLIIDHLGWQAHFRGIHALDALEPPAADKTALVCEVLRRESLTSAHTWMVGDSAEDRQAAEGNGLKFLAATWGYGAAAADQQDLASRLATPLELLQRVSAYSAGRTP